MTTIASLKKITLLLLAQIVLSATFASTALAQPKIEIEPIGRFDNLGDAIDILTKLILGGGAIACLAYLIYGAFKYITAGDESSTAATARTTMINACIGLVLLSLTYVIWVLILRITGIGVFSQGGV